MSSIKWREFHERHFNRMYTPVFNGYLEAVAANEEAPLLTRIEAWVLRHSWGNHADACVDGKGGRLTQADCARDLGLKHRQRVNPIFAELARLGFLRLNGQEIIPIDDPTEAEFDQMSVGPRTLSEEEAKVPSFLTYIQEVFAQEAPDEYREYQRIERERKEIRTRLMKRWEAFKELSAGPRTTDAARPQAPGQGVPRPQDKVSQGEETNGEPILIAETENLKQLASFSEKARPPATPEELLAAAVERSTLKDLPGNRAKAIQHAAARIASIHPEQRDAVLECFEADCRQLARRRDNKAKSWGIIVSAMEDAIRSAQTAKPKPKKADPPLMSLSLEEEIRIAEDWLAEFPNHASAPDTRRHLEKLRSELQRKPAAFEAPQQQAKKAGLP